MAEVPALSSVHVLVLPFPADGHMLPLLDFAHLLSSRFHLTVTVAVTTKNLPSLSPLLARSPSISPLSLPFPDYPALPPGAESVRDLPSMAYLATLVHAFAGLYQPLLRWARAHPNPPVAIISDLFCGWTRPLAEELGIVRLMFSPSGALAIAMSFDLWRRMPQRSDPDDPDELITVQTLPGSPAYRWRQLLGSYKAYKLGNPLSEFVREGFLDNIRSWGLIFNTFSELEGLYLDHMRTDLGHSRIWAVGPLAPAPADRGGSSSVAADEITAWLDGREEGSVLYVAFGSQAVLSPAQAAVLAAGLERSGASFIWSNRGGTSLPEGFEERVAGRGMVIRGWAPQLAILNHESVGSFVTHCGWNSLLEAVAAGLVVLTWPMTADQHVNARLMVEDAGIGVMLCGDGGDAIPEPEELARIIAETVGEPGKKMREKAKGGKKKAAEAVEEGGSSYKDLQGLVEEISKLAVNH